MEEPSIPLKKCSIIKNSVVCEASEKVLDKIEDTGFQAKNFVLKQKDESKETEDSCSCGN